MKFTYASFEMPLVVIKKNIIMRSRAAGFCQKNSHKKDEKALWFEAQINFHLWWGEGNTLFKIKFYDSLAKDFNATRVTVGHHRYERFVLPEDHQLEAKMHTIICHIITSTAFFNHIGCLPGVIKILKATEVKSKLLYGF